MAHRLSGKTAGVASGHHAASEGAPRHTRRVADLAIRSTFLGLIVAFSGHAASAQELVGAIQSGFKSPLPHHLTTQVLTPLSAPPLAGLPASALSGKSAGPVTALRTLEASFAALTVLDVASTTRAIESGAGREGNPILQGVVGSPVAFTAMKVGVAAGVIVLTEHLRRQHPTAAVLLMVGINGAYTAVVAHNYTVGGTR